MHIAACPHIIVFRLQRKCLDVERCLSRATDNMIGSNVGLKVNPLNLLSFAMVGVAACDGGTSVGTRYVTAAQVE